MSSPATEPAAQTRQRSGWVALVVAGLVPLVVYLATLTPAVLDDDPADLARQAYTLGLAYAPGYALNAMVGKMVTTCVPLGPKAWRANLVGALLAAASVVLGCAILRRWSVPTVPGIAAMWVLAFSPLFWSQALYINAFIMAVAFALATVLLLTLWAERRPSTRSGRPEPAERRTMRWLAAASAVFGLGLSAHPSFVLYAPAVGLFTAATLWREGRKRLLMGLGAAALGGLAGCVPWLVCSAHYLYQESSDRLVPRLVLLLTAAEGRSDWGMYVTAAFWHQHLGRLALHATRTFAQFSLGGVVLALVGLVSLWRRRRAAVLLLAVGYAVQANFAATIDNWHHFDVYRLASYVLLALVMGVGLGAVWTWAARPLRRCAACGILAALTIGPPYAALSGARAADAPAMSAQAPFHAAFARQVQADAATALEQAEGSVVIASWMGFATLRFLQQVEGRGSEVGLVWARGDEAAVLEQIDLLPAAPRLLCYVRPGQDEVLEKLLAQLDARRIFVGRLHELYEIPERR